MKTAVEVLFKFLQDVCTYIPPGLLPCLGAGFLEGGKYLKSFRHELVGSLLMIGCTFSAGKWFFSESVRMSWTAHFMGVIAADYLGGGPHVNPAVTVTMVCLGKCTYTEGYIRIAGQISGGKSEVERFCSVFGSADRKNCRFMLIGNR